MITGTITLENHRVNHVFREGVADLVTTKNQHRPFDFISVATARQQILNRTGLTVSQSTTARWIAHNNLGHKLPGYKEQWIVDGALFKKFLLEVAKLK